MTDLPPAPEGGEELLVREAPTKKGTAWPVLVFVTLLIGAAAALFVFLTGSAKAPEKPVPSVAVAPEAPEGEYRTFTQEELDSKSDRAAFYIGRDQVEGANTVMGDFLEGTGCVPLFAGSQVFATEDAARAMAGKFRQDAKRDFGAVSGLRISTGFSELASGRWVVSAIVLDCP